MSLSRRKFLHAGTLVALSAGLPLKSLFGGTLNAPAAVLLPMGRGGDAVSRLNHETFVRHLNSMFSLRHQATKGLAKLIEVKDWTPNAVKPSARAAGTECFSALFLGSSENPLRQETYSVEHDSLGRFDMLLVPVGRDHQGFHYEAVFNRLF